MQKIEKNRTYWFITLLTFLGLACEMSQAPAAIQALATPTLPASSGITESIALPQFIDQVSAATPEVVEQHLVTQMAGTPNLFAFIDTEQNKVFVQIGENDATTFGDAADFIAAQGSLFVRLTERPANGGWYAGIVDFADSAYPEWSEQEIKGIEGEVQSLSLSLQHDKLAVVLEDAINVYNTADLSFQRIEFPGIGETVSWSPDGNNLVFAQNGDVVIYTYNASEAFRIQQQVMNRTDIGEVRYPVWTDSGILFDSFVPSQGDGPGTTSFYTYTPFSGEFTNAPVLQGSIEGQLVSQPVVSETGKVAFATDRGVSVLDRSSGQMTFAGEGSDPVWVGPTLVLNAPGPSITFINP